MTLADMPLAAFDIESSGIDVREDFIVTASLVLITADGPKAHEWLLSPPDGREIPQSAIDVHGVTNDHACANGMDYATGYQEIRQALTGAWTTGYLVAVMNAAFDCSILHYEGLRLGYGALEHGPIIDPLPIDKHLDRYRRGGRTLTDLAKHYGVEQGDAHQSTGDCYTVARIAYKLVRSPKLAEVDDAETLQQLQRSWRAEQQDSLRAFWQGRGDERWRTVSSDWPVIS